MWDLVAAYGQKGVDGTVSALRMGLLREGLERGQIGVR